jgi:peptidyl-tRNA hydrolase, PTH1 family
MKIIVGLGNPGIKYEITRHNAGFLAVDYLLKSGDMFMMARPAKEFEAETFTQQDGDVKIVLMKPQTFMNDSGLAIKAIFDISKDVLVSHDEVDLPFGTLRINKNSSAAGNNGVESIIRELGTQDFTRMRIGIETRTTRADMPTDAFVLSPFTTEELDMLEKEVFPKIAEQVSLFIHS